MARASVLRVQKRGMFRSGSVLNGDGLTQRWTYARIQQEARGFCALTPAPTQSPLTSTAGSSAFCPVPF